MNHNEVACWVGSRGTIVLEPHLCLAEFPDETFIKSTVDIDDVPTACALRRLQATCGALREHVWEMNPDD